MKKFVIHGNKRLSGRVRVSGSKNAVLPILFATLLIDGTSVIENVPDITDVGIALEILCELGARVKRELDTLTVDTSSVVYKAPSDTLVSKIRASTYLLGASVGRFGVAKIQRFGGCNFDSRPIDMHLYAFSSLGATVNGDTVTAKVLRGTDIIFSKVSVGATVNAILSSVTANGVTRIFSYAREPHVLALIDFLSSAGADVTVYPDYIRICGRPLHSARARIIPDMIEAGTYIALSLMTNSPFEILDAVPLHLASFLELLDGAGVSVVQNDGGISVYGEIKRPLTVKTAPYPHFPTDLQPITAPLMAKFCGGKIVEEVWQNRFGYLSELSKFGFKYTLCENTATIYPSQISSATSTAPDLRGGASLLLSALATEGESVIYQSDIIKRGYGRVVEHLRVLGADIVEEE